MYLHAVVHYLFLEYFFAAVSFIGNNYLVMQQNTSW